MREDAPAATDAPRTGADDARPDAGGALGFLAYAVEWAVLKPLSKLRRR